MAVRWYMPVLLSSSKDIFPPYDSSWKFILCRFGFQGNLWLYPSCGSGFSISYWSFVCSDPDPDSFHISTWGGSGYLKYSIWVWIRGGYKGLTRGILETYKGFLEQFGGRVILAPLLFYPLIHKQKIIDPVNFILLEWIFFHMRSLKGWKVWFFCCLFIHYDGLITHLPLTIIKHNFVTIRFLRL